MIWEDERRIDPLEFAARVLYVRKFHPGATVPGDDWTDFITTVAGKPETDFTAGDWRRVQDTMRRYIHPDGVAVDPCGYCEWYADQHGQRAE